MTHRGQEGTLGLIGLLCCGAGLLCLAEEALGLVKEAGILESDTHRIGKCLEQTDV